MREAVALTLTLLLASIALVVFAQTPAQAVGNPWTGSVMTRSFGVDDPPPVVDDEGPSIVVTRDTETRWNYTMNWAPLADQATSTDPFNTVIQARASGSIFWQRTDRTTGVYKPPFDPVGNFDCTTITTVTWSGDLAPTGNLLPTAIEVTGQPASAGGFDVTVRATMSMDRVVENTTVRSGNDLGADVCNDDTQTFQDLWHDTVVMDFHSPDPPTRLEGTGEVPARSYLQFEPTAIATVDLTRENHPPVAVHDDAQTDPGEGVDIDVLGNDFDPDGDAIDVISVTKPLHGTALIERGAAVSVRYIPDPGFAGDDDVFGYQITDGLGATDTGSIRVSVGPNRPPDAVADTATTAMEQAVDVPVLANDSDPDGDPVTLRSCTTPDHGTVVILGSLVRVTPQARFTGIVAFECTVADPAGATDTAPVTVTVTGATLEVAVRMDYSLSWLDLAPALRPPGTDYLRADGATTVQVTGAGDISGWVRRVCVTPQWTAYVVNSASNVPVFWFEGGVEVTHPDADTQWVTPPPTVVRAPGVTGTRLTRDAPWCGAPGQTTLTWSPDGPLEALSNQLGRAVRFARLEHSALNVTVELTNGRLLTLPPVLNETENAPRNARITDLDESFGPYRFIL